MRINWHKKTKKMTDILRSRNNDTEKIDIKEGTNKRRIRIKGRSRQMGGEENI